MLLFSSLSTLRNLSVLQVCQTLSFVHKILIVSSRVQLVAQVCLILSFSHEILIFSRVVSSRAEQPVGVTDTQRDDAYAQWLQGSI